MLTRDDAYISLVDPRSNTRLEIWIMKKESNCFAERCYADNYATQIAAGLYSRICEPRKCFACSRTNASSNFNPSRVFSRLRYIDKAVWCGTYGYDFFPCLNAVCQEHYVSISRAAITRMELFLRRNSATSSRLRKHYDFQSLGSHIVSQIHKSASRVTSVTSLFTLLHSFDRFSEIVDGSEMVRFTWTLDIVSVIALRETNFDRMQLNRLFLRNWRVTRVSEWNEFYVYEKWRADRFEFGVLLHVRVYGKK